MPVYGIILFMAVVYSQASWPCDLDSLIAAIPELDAISAEKIHARAGSHPLLLIAESEEQIAGFKLGYALSSDTFYSWIGAVAPAFRKQGVARGLLKRQEQLVRDKGFTRIQVKSMNRFPAMLRFLIAEGYEITDVEHRENHPAKIVFEKTL